MFVDNLSVSDFVIYEPLLLQSGQSIALQLVATPSKNEVDGFLFEISSKFNQQVH
jgi:hypothetical protein